MNATQTFNAGLGAIVVYPKYNEDGTDRIFKISGYRQDDHSVWLSDKFITTMSSINDIEPIPLNSSEFKRLGFDRTGQVFSFDDIQFLRNKGDFYFMGRIYSEMKYVHDVQKVVFALCGIEITYTHENGTRI